METMEVGGGAGREAGGGRADLEPDADAGWAGCLPAAGYTNNVPHRAVLYLFYNSIPTEGRRNADCV